MSLLLETKKLSRTYLSLEGRETNALVDVDVKVSKGQMVAVTGPSGCGKSTLLYAVGGLNKPDGGNVIFNGTDLYNETELNDYRSSKVSFVFQQFHLIPYLTVEENIRAIHSKKFEKSRFEEFITKCNIDGLAKRFPEELSVGEKQRVAFIRAVIHKPDLILADEPTGNLDPENTMILLTLLEEFVSEGGTVVLVTHDMSIAERCNIRFSMEMGRIQS